MKSLRHSVIVLAGSVALFSTGLTPAHSSVEDELEIPDGVTVDQEIEEHLESLPPEERQEFVDTMLPAEEHSEITDIERVDTPIADEEGPVTSNSTCYRLRYNGGRSAAAGNRLYDYWHVGRWCVSGGQVTSASILENGAQTHTPGWRYNGVQQTNSGVVSNQGRSFTQFSFTLGSNGIDVLNRAPCIRVNGTPAGTATGTLTCGIY